MTHTPKKTAFDWWSTLWDMWCVFSIIGIWPRFIEPRLLRTSRLTISLPDLAQSFDGIKILYFSDLHISTTTSNSFLQRVSKKIAALRPDVVMIGGDLISYADMDGRDKLSSFLNSLKAPLGIYCCLGNHDYRDYVTLGSKNTFVKKSTYTTPLLRGLKRLFHQPARFPSQEPETTPDIVTTPVPLLPELVDLIEKSGVTLLHNSLHSISKDGKKIQIIGLGDLMTGHCRPEKAFSALDIRYPSIVLSHNPDSWPLLEPYPGNVYLFGHTHGGQVNLPFMWRRLTPIIHKEMKRGLFIKPGAPPCNLPRSLYVSRGIGSTFKFRWFSSPELVLITLKKAGPQSIKETSFFQKLLQLFRFGSEKKWSAACTNSSNTST